MMYEMLFIWTNDQNHADLVISFYKCSQLPLLRSHSHIPWRFWFLIHCDSWQPCIYHHSWWFQQFYVDDTFNILPYSHLFWSQPFPWSTNNPHHRLNFIQVYEYYCLFSTSFLLIPPILNSPVSPLEPTIHWFKYIFTVLSHLRAFLPSLSD